MSLDSGRFGILGLFVPCSCLPSPPPGPPLLTLSSPLLSSPFRGLLISFLAYFFSFKDGDGEISKEECASAGHSAEQVEAIFEKVDADGDGKLSKEEMVASGMKDAKEAAAKETAAVTCTRKSGCTCPDCAMAGTAAPSPADAGSGGDVACSRKSGCGCKDCAAMMGGEVKQGGGGVGAVDKEGTGEVKSAAGGAATTNSSDSFGSFGNGKAKMRQSGKAQMRRSVCQDTPPRLATSTAASAAARVADLVVGAVVVVTGGKYDGRTGEITSVAEKTCKLSIDDVETGSIKKDQLAVATTPFTALSPGIVAAMREETKTGSGDAEQDGARAIYDDLLRHKRRRSVFDVDLQGGLVLADIINASRRPSNDDGAAAVYFRPYGAAQNSIDAMYSAMSKDGNGCVTFPHFEAWLAGNSEPLPPSPAVSASVSAAVVADIIQAAADTVGGVATGGSGDLIGANRLVCISGNSRSLALPSDLLGNMRKVGAILAANADRCGANEAEAAETMRTVRDNIAFLERISGCACPGCAAAAENTAACTRQSGCTCANCGFSAFATVDADGSGGIDIAELKSMAAAGGQALNDEEAADAMAAIDTDGNGSIDKEEFAKFLSKGLTPHTESVLTKMQAVGRGMAARAAQRKQKDAATKLQALLRGTRVRIPQAKVDKLFAKADADGSGNIDVAELKRMAAAEGRTLTDVEAAAAIVTMDTDGNRTIDKKEFEAFLNKDTAGGEGALNNAATKLQALLRGASVRKEPVSEKTVNSLFTAVDADGSGGIDIAELQSMAVGNGETLTDAEAADIMAALDINGNGTIDKDEFAAWLNGPDSDAEDAAKIIGDGEGADGAPPAKRMSVATAAKMDVLRAKLLAAGIAEIDQLIATTDEEAGGSEAKAGDKGGSDDSDCSDNDGAGVDDEEAERLMMQSRSRKRRGSVSAEVMAVGGESDAAYVKKVVPKTPEQTAAISVATGNNFLFQNLSAEGRKEVLDSMERKEVSAEEAVITQGAEGDYFYVVETGEFDVFVEGKNEGKPVFHYAPGASFGELALMYNAPREATVKCCGEGGAVLWCVDRATFRHIIVASTNQTRKLHDSYV